ncbi:MAG: class I SAM-dependent methyltransferase [Calditrichaeota bacterium]|nr:class I SAM-dependent methyltransferase [Calditrichota bacterium]
MNIYTGLFPLIYDMYWPAFGRSAAPMICDFYSNTAAGKEKLPVLDLCCGTGDLALHFLQNGFPVTGVDISAGMLDLAREKTADFLENGAAQFIESDVSKFNIDNKFGLVVSTYDSFNHLPEIQQIKQTLANAKTMLLDDGWLIFDMNTERGLRQFTNIQVMDQQEVLMISRSIFDARNACSILEITGFVKNETGQFERFDQSLTNFVYNLREIFSYLIYLGFRNVHFCSANDLSQNIHNPEDHERIFFVAQR